MIKKFRLCLLVSIFYVSEAVSFPPSVNPLSDDENLRSIVPQAGGGVSQNRKIVDQLVEWSGKYHVDYLCCERKIRSRFFL